MVIASSLLLLQMYFSAMKSLHTFGRDGSLNMAQLKSLKSCMQCSPANFPLGIPGIGDVIEGAMQQAPQLDRHCMIFCLILNE
ncbi:hypothetical protein IF202_11540 [Marinomonas sp. SM2066]|uniref:Uncharacterized protein n=1 Tax=Marinomonas colpomeniae TaxID=2774408 RepID=A0ABR8P1D6_9GAMM|nr:hypothetical protein [Marinomonas colpomeniae]